MKKRFDLIIFDWDGTLINSIDWIVSCLQTAAADCQCDIPEQWAVRDVIGLSIENAVETLFPRAQVEARECLIKNYTNQFRSREMDRGDLFPGVYDMLVKLNDSGYRLAVATGKTRSGLEQVMQSTGTKELFYTTRCADETASKPDPSMLREIIRFTDSSYGRAVMVGDTVHDLQMAQNAQISSVAVTCGAHPEALLQQYQPMACLQQPADLLNFIEG